VNSVPKLWVNQKSLLFLKKEKSRLEEMKKVILEALEKRYEAQIAEADATIKIYFENSVGIGEHPQHIEEVDKLIEKIATAEEKLQVLKEFE
jgi:predicted sugar kinase